MTVSAVNETMIGQLFEKTRHGDHHVVVLRGLRRTKVVLSEIGHSEQFTMPTARFMKFYALRQSRTEKPSLPPVEPVDSTEKEPLTIGG